MSTPKADPHAGFREPNGYFKPGNKGSPGRPSDGEAGRIRERLNKHKADFVDKLQAMALEGDPAALKLALAYLETPEEARHLPPMCDIFIRR